jgi:hypothetical protein
MSIARRFLELATCTALLTACGSEYQPYTSAPEPPTPPLEALLVRAGPNSTGTGTVAGSGIDCAISGATLANTCAASLRRGNVVTLTADATGGSTFLAWGDACAASGASPKCTVMLSEALAVSASFSAPTPPVPPPPPPPPPPTFVVTVRAGTGSTGSGAVSGAGINCAIAGTSQSGDCSAELAQGAQLTLTAAASGGGSFIGWGGACTSAGSTSSCTITVNQATNLDASFAAPPTPPPPPPPPPPTYTVTLRARATSGGTGTVAGTGISCSITASSQSGDCSETFPEGTMLTLSATATGGSSFAGWGGACAAAGTSATCALSVSQNTSVDASFAPPPPTYVVTVVAGSSSTGTGTLTGPGIQCTISGTSQSGDCSEELVQGTQLQLTSASTGGSTFAGWDGACSQAGTAATCTIVMSSAATVGASFAAPPPPNLAGFWSGSDAGTNIHYHITFAQTGPTLSLASCVSGDCRLTALTSNGSGWLGASYVDIASLTGTVSATSVTFTMNLGDRTVKFDGALSSPTRMVGQVSGPTMPLQSLTLDRQ